MPDACVCAQRTTENGQRRLHSPIYIIRVANLKDLWRPTSFFIVPPLQRSRSGIRTRMLPSIESRIAAELSVKPQQVIAAVALLDEGATVPFIARYRKEVTERSRRYAVAHARGAACVSARAGRAPRGDSREHRRTEEADAGAARRASKRRTPSSGSKTCICRTSPNGAPRRRSHAKPASMGWRRRCLPIRPDPEAEAAKYLKPAFTSEQGENPGVPDVKAALEGARAILIEQFAEDAELLGQSARTSARSGRRRFDGRRRQGRGGRQVPRLLRLQRADQEHSFASRAGAVSRPQGRVAAS